jgi:hypothetical protein
MAGPIPAASGRIFISYRREDTAYPAAWLYDRLADRYGDGQIFKDVDSIELGDDFVQVITTAVESCDVLLALIGEDWLPITDAHGRRRLDDPDDFVRLEIEAALARNVRVIPILVGDATMPQAEELPHSLVRLARRQALELSPVHFDFDTGRLLKVLDGTLAKVRTAQDEAASITAPAEKESEPSTVELLRTPAGKESEPSTVELLKAPTEPEPAGAVPAPRQQPTTSATTPIYQPQGGPSKLPGSGTPPLADIDHRAARQARIDHLLLVAGQLAIVGAALLVAGLFPAYIYSDSLWKGREDHHEMRWYAMYALTVGVLALGAGACTLIPRTRRLIGPGLLLGLVAASTWGFLYLITDRMRDNEIRWAGWWLELLGHLVLVLAACLSWLAMARTADVRVERRAPRGELAWLVALLGAAGALALVFHDQHLWNIEWAQNRWLVVSSIWATAMALVVPACASVAVPRRFAVALLAGWIGGGAALFRFHYLWAEKQYDGGTGSSPIIIFGLTLVALSGVSLPFARAGTKV